MSEYIHQDDAYTWLRDKEIQFAEQDFAKVQAERDNWKRIATGLYNAHTEKLGWKYAARMYEEGINND
jgi:hypothetical protein